MVGSILRGLQSTPIIFYYRYSIAFRFHQVGFLSLEAKATCLRMLKSQNRMQLFNDNREAALKEEARQMIILIPWLRCFPDANYQNIPETLT